LKYILQRFILQGGVKKYYLPEKGKNMKRQIVASINNIANELDRNGLYAEANALTKVMKKLAFDKDFDEEGTHDDMFGEMDDDREPNLPDPPGNNSNVAVRRSERGFYVSATLSTDKDNIYLGEKSGRESAGGFKSPFENKMDAIVYAQEWADELGEKYDILFTVVDRTKPKPFSPDTGAMRYEEDRDERSSH
jgi:hypothetical protein